MASRKIADLQPLLQLKAKAWLALCEQEWPGAGVEPLITNTRRTREEQEALYAQGRSKPGKVVTWTKESPHLYGCAWDYVPLRMGKPVWGNRTPDDLRLWTRMGELAERLGLEWGGRWKRPDMPHVQFREWRSHVM